MSLMIFSQEFPMGGARTKMDENSEYASGEWRVASEHSLSPQSSALSTIFVGVP